MSKRGKGMTTVALKLCDFEKPELQLRVVSIVSFYQFHLHPVKAFGPIKLLVPASQQTSSSYFPFLFDPFPSKNLYVSAYLHEGECISKAFIQPSIAQEEDGAMPPKMLALKRLKQINAILTNDEWISFIPQFFIVLPYRSFDLCVYNYTLNQTNAYWSLHTYYQSSPIYNRITILFPRRRFIQLFFWLL